MGRFDVLQVCLQGHIINGSFIKMRELNRDFCSFCQYRTIIKCKNCNANIDGNHYIDEYTVDELQVAPLYCNSCGIPHPWKDLLENNNEDTEESEPELILENIFSRFHYVARQLRDRRKDKDDKDKSKPRPTLDVTDEYDVQDLFHALARLFFAIILPEEWAPSYAGTSSRMDFLLKNEEIVVEIKKTRPSLTAKQLGDDLIVDIARYKKHPNCKILFCFVYDPDGIIPNPESIESDLSNDYNELPVKVFIYPK